MAMTGLGASNTTGMKVWVMNGSSIGGGGDASAANQTSQITQETAINTVLGVKADAKSTATDTTAISAMSVWKQISASVQSLVTGIVLAAGSAIIGKVGIDQTTPGTTNGVQVNAALPAGTNLLGKVGIDQTTAGSTNAVQEKQYTGVPSNFAVATADGTVFTLAAGERGFIQNLDSADALAVKYGASASTSSLNFILPCGAAQDDGNGGSIWINDWIGVVSVATMTGVGRYIAWKVAP